MDEIGSWKAVTYEEQHGMEVALEIASKTLWAAEPGASGVGAFVVRDGSVLACIYRSGEGGKLSEPRVLAGPNGGRVGFDKDRRLMEWLPSEDHDGEVFSMILRRSDDEVHEACAEFLDKVWWNRHQIWLEKIARGEESSDHPSYAKACETAERIEEKYGIDNLGWDDFEWGIVNGKLSALLWVLGEDMVMLGT